MEVLEEMSSASLRRGWGDKCLLLVQSPGDYRQPWSRCLLTPSCECALTCVFSNAAVFTRIKGFLFVCAHLFMHARLKARVWVSVNVSYSVCVLERVCDSAAEGYRKVSSDSSSLTK